MAGLQLEGGGVERESIAASYSNLNIKCIKNGQGPCFQLVHGSYTRAISTGSAEQYNESAYLHIFTQVSVVWVAPQL